jgi:hypothetical protein
MMKSLISTALALAALSVAGSAQQSAKPFQQIQGAPHKATLNMATGEITRAGQTQKALNLKLKYDNTDYSGYYSIPGSGREWLDWGICPDSDTTTDITAMYCTGYGTSVISTWNAGPGASLCNTFYDGTTGWCADLGTPLKQWLCYSGLPGHPDGTVAWGWSICVVLTGGYEFSTPPGPMGYSFSFFDSSTGPLLMYAGSANMGTGFDENGQEDAFDIYIPYVSSTSALCGTYWFGGYPNNFSSWWLEMWNYCDAKCTWYCGSGTNCNGYTVIAPPVLGGSFMTSVSCAPQAGAFIVAFSSAVTFPSPFGEILVNINDPNGELSGTPSAFGDPAMINAFIPPVLAFMCFTFYTQAVAFGGGLTLTCAFECTVGY